MNNFTHILGIDVIFNFRLVVFSFQLSKLKQKLFGDFHGSSVLFSQRIRFKTRIL